MATATRRRSTRPTSSEPDVSPEAVLDALESQTILDVLAARRWDIHGFARDALGIDAHAGQDALFDLVLARLPDGTPAYLTIPVSAGNRAGKTLGLTITVLHQTLYKHGLPAPIDGSTAKAWALAPYDWYHFGITQEVTELVHMEAVRILSGVHEAQKGRGCPLSSSLGEDIADWDRKERGEWGWFKWSALLGGGEIHFRTTGEKALSTLGRDMNGWSWDEPAFDPNLTFVFDEVLNLRRMSTGGQAILIATATEGNQQYEDLWKRGDPLAPDRDPDFASLRISTRQNVGYGISSTMFERMLRTVPVALVPQNIDGYFIEARETYFAKASVETSYDRGRDLPERQGWRAGHRYAHGVDPALTYDSTFSIVLDTTDPDCWVGVDIARRTGRQTAESLVGLAADVAHEYGQGGQCTSGIDATGFGGKVFRSLLQSARVSAYPVEFGGRSTTKPRLLNNVRVALDTGRLVLPKTGLWLVLRRQLLGYKLADRKLSTDAVMALVVAVKMAARTMYGEGKPLPFDFFAPLPALPARPHPDVSSEAAPSHHVDDRLARLDSLSGASVVSLGAAFRR